MGHDTEDHDQMTLRNTLIYVGISGRYDSEGQPVEAQISNVSPRATEQATVPPSVMALLAWAVE
jgi:hypothetical protein